MKSDNLYSSNSLDGSIYLDNSNFDSEQNINDNAGNIESDQIPIQIKRVNISESNSEPNDSIANNIAPNQPAQPAELEIAEMITKPLKSDLVGSNRNVVNDDTIIKKQAIGLNTETLKQYLKPVEKIDSQNYNPDRDFEKPWEIDRRKGSKVYELIGYTTLSKIHHGIKKDNRQSLLKRILIALMLFVIIFIILYVMNPIKDLVDFKRIIGIESMSGEDYSEPKNNREQRDINNVENNIEKIQIINDKFQILILNRQNFQNLQML